MPRSKTSPHEALGAVEVDSYELYEATELRVVVWCMPNLEMVVTFEDCSNTVPVVYLWCLDAAVQWLRSRGYLARETGI